MKLLLYIFPLLYINLVTFGQDSTSKRRVSNYLGVSSVISTSGDTPFWMKANQYGVVPSKSPYLLVRGGIQSNYRKGKRFDWAYGLELAGNISANNPIDTNHRGAENSILIPQLFVKAKLGIFEIYVGRRKEIVGLVDSTLSSGSYIWSGNALPMPKIQISIPNFVPIKFTGGILSIKGNFAHGWFENDRTDVKNFYLHQKSIYFKIGKPNWKMSFYTGFNHQAQWGGELITLNSTLAKDGKLPSSFKDYLGIITGKSLAVESDTSKYGFADAGNRAGNHLGTVDIGFEIKTKNFNVLLYRQNIYEDGSLFYLSNIADGLNGISITNKKKASGLFTLNKVVFEYLDTRSQGGERSSEETNSYFRGNDDYLNHGQFDNGWSYHAKGIGTPFIVSSQDLSIPKSSFYFENNKVSVLYLGLAGIIKQTIMIDGRFSYSFNYGRTIYPYIEEKKQFSGLVRVKIPTKLFSAKYISAIAAYDQGELLKKGGGVYLGVVW